RTLPLPPVARVGRIFIVRVGGGVTFLDLVLVWMSRLHHLRRDRFGTMPVLTCLIALEIPAVRSVIDRFPDGMAGAEAFMVCACKGNDDVVRPLMDDMIFDIPSIEKRRGDEHRRMTRELGAREWKLSGFGRSEMLLQRIPGRR